MLESSMNNLAQLEGVPMGTIHREAFLKKTQASMEAGFLIVGVFHPLPSHLAVFQEANFYRFPASAWGWLMEMLLIQACFTGW